MLNIENKTDIWQDCYLGDMVTFQRGFDITQKDQLMGKYPVISSSGIGSYHSDFKVEGPGVVIGRKGTLGTVFYQKGNYWPHDTTLWVKDFHGNDPKFIFYFLKGFKFENYDVGTSNPTLNRNHIHLIPTKYPPLPEQRAIASVLSSLDDKIDLLHRQNRTLEGMAEALFRQWFVLRQAQQPEADEGWEEVAIGELFKISSGKGLKHEEFLENGAYPVLGANGTIGRTSNYNFNEKLLFTGRVGTLGNIFIVENEKVWLSDNTLVIVPNKYFYSVYFILKIAKLEELNVGSTQPLLRQSDVKDIQFNLPPENILIGFERITSDIFLKIQGNNSEIITLEKLRDTLLPKLMSGEVRVEVK
jgi:type I restriction enzyme S subunit